MNGVRVVKEGDNSVRVPTEAGVQYLIAPAVAPAHPIGMYTNPKRRVGATAVAAEAVKDGIMASSNGSAMATPAPRRNVRRGKAFLVIIIVISSFEMVCC